VKALGDSSASVAIVAAEVLGRFGSDGEKEAALNLLLKHADQEQGNVFDAILAGNSLDYLGEAALTRAEAIEALPMKSSKRTPRTEGYVANLLESILRKSGK
jgi:hypothetical protein